MSDLPSLVLLDVGGVLLHLNPWSEALSGIDGLPDGVSPMGLIGSGIFGDYETGKLGSDAFFEAVREFLSVDLSDAVIRRHFSGILGEPVSGMPEIIAELKARGVRVCGLSDTSPIHVEIFENYPAIAALERLVTSFETGFQKPAREAFERALQLLGAEPSSTFFVDDTRVNVEPIVFVNPRIVAARNRAKSIACRTSAVSPD